MSDAIAASLSKLVETIGSGQPPIDAIEEVTSLPGEAVLSGLLYGMLRWDASASQARNAIGRIQAAVVDLNELRIAYPDEIMEVLGPRYPNVEERSERIRAMLHAVFNLEHCMSLEHLCDMPKREVRAAVEQLEGVPQFAAHRTLLVYLDVHCMPVDEQLLESLIGEGVLEEGTSAEDASGKLERAVRAADAKEWFLHLEGWSETASRSRTSGR